MKLETRTRNTFLTTVVLLCLCIAATVLLLRAPVVSVAADQSGGSLIDYSVGSEYVASLTLDANGYVSSDPETNVDTVKSNNSQRFRKRTISADALRGMPASGDWNGTYADNFTVYNDTKEYFTVTAGSGEIVIEALKSTHTLTVKPRFAIVFTTVGSDPIQKTLLVSVTVNSGNAVRDVTGADRLFVGKKVNAGSDDSLPIKITNYQSVEIDLNEYLLGRELYLGKDPGSPSNTTVNNPTRDFENKDEYHIQRKGDAMSECAMFRDLSEFSIVGNPSCRPVIDSEYTFYQYAQAQNRHSFIVTVNLDSVRVANAARDGHFWYDETDYNYYEMAITLQDTNQKNIVVYLPIAFTPSSTPKTRAEFQMDTDLNAASDEVYETYNGVKDAAGYRSVRVYPEYLCDFPTISDYTMWFRESEPPEVTKGASNVDITYGVDEEHGAYFQVNAKQNSDAVDIIFHVKYGNEAIDYIEPHDVTVSFTVYGGYGSVNVHGQYGIALTLKGKKHRTYSINSNEFSRLREDGYQIHGAELVRYKDDKAYAVVEYSNGKVIITPKDSVSDANAAAARITFKNAEGRTVRLDCPLTIDMKAGNIFNEWETWQVVLFWIGIGLAAALVILFFIWLFIRSVHKHKMDELETTAPTSAYIIKLNSTIAAAQAQQRLATQGFNAPQSQTLALGAGAAAGPAPDPNTLALGTTAQQNTATPSFSMGATTMTGTGGTMVPPTTPLPPISEEIVIPLTDEELLTRIYEEKFEPRGMLKRTFDKSKDLQQRELEREKERIREDVRNGMTIEEACKSLRQRESEATGFAATGSTVTKTMENPTVQLDPLVAALGFDPSDPIISDVKREDVPEDASAEEKKLKEAEYNNLRLRSELSIIDSRIEAITSATEHTETEITDANASIETLSFEIKESEQKLDDKNTDLAVERRKSAKEALNKEIAELESKIKSDKDALSGKRSDVEFGTELLGRIKEVAAEYADKKEATEALVATSDAELETARKEAQHAADLAAKAKKQAELAVKLETLNPLMLTVNTLDGEIKELVASIEGAAGEKDLRKTRVAALQNELIATTDPAKITEISNAIKNLNKEISDIDHAATANTTLKSNKGIEMAAARRKANEFIDKEQVELEDVIAAEDKIIADIAHRKMIAAVEADKASAEEQVAHWQSECDTLTGNLDTLVMEAAAGVAEHVKSIEDALQEAKTKLSDTEAALAGQPSEEEQLNLTMEQMTLNEEIERLTGELEVARADGIKANLEFRNQGEAELENARAELARATEAFNAVTERHHEVSTAVNPLDLITSGSGVISQDRKKIEAENLKKILAEQQSALEQAKLQAQLAQQEAEKAVADAQRASEESRAEAERLAREALQKAEDARQEAERKSQEEADRMREEAERVKQEAQEEIERVRLEAEEARKAAEEEAARARQEAEEEAERARKEAEEEAERARLAAEEEAEKARKAAEEEAERIRLENEESKRLAEEEAEKARQQAAEEEAKKAEEAKQAAEEEAKRKARIEEKVAKRKAAISELRAELKNVADEEQGLALREKFYAMQLALDEDEKTSSELTDLLNKSMDDASHAAELSRYKKLANQKPRRIVKKVTERVNRIPKKRPGTASARPGARPAGARPAGARPAARPGVRPTGARPAGARPAARPGVRPSGARPSGTRPTRPGNRPSGK